MKARQRAKDDDKPKALWIFEQAENLLQFCSEAEKHAAGNTINLIWKVFFLKYGSVENYQKLPDSEKGEFLQKLSDMQQHIIEEEQQGKAPPGSAHGACLVVLYITAITCNEGAKVINHMADVVEKYGLMAAQ